MELVVSLVLILAAPVWAFDNQRDTDSSISNFIKDAGEINRKLNSGLIAENPMDRI